MRSALIAMSVFSVFTLAAASAQAALVWSETTERGVPVVRWAMGANINEAHAAAKVAAGQPISVIASCRQTGYFAYVGSVGQTQHGVSCGYATKQAALHEARMECEQEFGRCDLEKVGHDNGAAIAENAVAAGLPDAMPGATLAESNMRSIPTIRGED